MRYDARASRHPLPIATMLTAERAVCASTPLARGSYRHAASRHCRRGWCWDLKSNRVSAVVISVTRCDLGAPRRRRWRSSESSRVFPPVALLHAARSIHAPNHAVAGVDRVSANSWMFASADGWRELRNCLLSTRGEDIPASRHSGRLAARSVGRAAGLLALLRVRSFSCRRACLRCECLRGGSMFFKYAHEPVLSRASFRRPSSIWRPRVSSARLGSSKSRLLAWRNIANHLDYSSPQSFGRHVSTLMALTADTIPRAL